MSKKRTPSQEQEKKVKKHIFDFLESRVDVRGNVVCKTLYGALVRIGINCSGDVILYVKPKTDDKGSKFYILT